MAHRRILAVDPTSRGFGYVVIEAGRLIDWGTTCVKSSQNGPVLKRFAELTQRMQPQRVILENPDNPQCRRSARVRNLLMGIGRLAQSESRMVQWMVLAKVEQRFARVGATTRAQRAVWIAARVAELVERLPRQRKAWMSEDERMSIFVAATLAHHHIPELNDGLAA